MRVKEKNKFYKIFKEKIVKWDKSMRRTLKKGEKFLIFNLFIDIFHFYSLILKKWSKFYNNNLYNLIELKWKKEDELIIVNKNLKLSNFNVIKMDKINKEINIERKKSIGS